MPRTRVTAIARRNAGPVVAADRPDGELAGERAHDQQDRRRPDERQDLEGVLELLRRPRGGVGAGR